MPKARNSNKPFIKTRETHKADGGKGEWSDKQKDDALTIGCLLRDKWLAELDAQFPSLAGTQQVTMANEDLRDRHEMLSIELGELLTTYIEWRLHRG